MHVSELLRNLPLNLDRCKDLNSSNLSEVMAIFMGNHLTAIRCSEVEIRVVQRGAGDARST